MNPLAVTFTLLASFFLFRLSRRWAPLPLLIGAGYMTLGQSIEVGPFHFTVIRILVAMGALRVMIKGEHMVGHWNSLDRMMTLWGLWAIGSSIFHKDVAATLISHLGLAYDALGLYFLLRVFISDLEDILVVCKIVIILLIPIAAEMILESITGRNTFSVFGGVFAECEVRGGKIRAQGPFAHSILAGTVGGVCLPMALLFWRKARRLAVVGLLVTGAMVVTSRSSGPILTAFFGLFGLALWKVRAQLRLIRWAAVLALVGLNIVMNAPIFYLLARIDLTGSSTSWYRAALIDSAFKHLSEWWLGGTDYTRHWMTTGVAWSENHSDITNNYLKMGVLGGLPLMLLFGGVLVSGFSSVGKALRLRENATADAQFKIWTLGSILFSHAASMMSVSYFDQSVIFLYLVLAAIGSVRLTSIARAPFSCEATVLQIVGDERTVCNNS